MTSAADRKLNAAVKAWRRVCPEDPMDIENIRGGLTACAKVKKALSTAKTELKNAAKNSTTFDDFDLKEVETLLTEVDKYVAELQQQQKNYAVLKKWLTKVKSASTGLPCSFVVRGNGQGSLHVHKTESNVNRSARTGKSEITGSRAHPGTCRYTGGKLVFTFDGTARAPWKTLLQKIVGKAGMNMKVALDGFQDTDPTN